MTKQAQRLLLLIVLLVVVLGGGYALVQKTNLVTKAGIIKDSDENVSDFSAVFLTNGQVYFGKVYSDANAEVDLREIYYLQVSQQDLQNGTKTATPTPSPDISLVKLGNELHGPNDRMRINRDQVLFIESLKNDSQVVKAIDDYKKKNK
jgi:hypothetical protein